MGKSPDDVAGWECGQGQPTVRQLENLARILKRPLATFFLPTPPEAGPALPKDRRRLAQGATSYTPALRYEIRVARYRRRVALDLYEVLQENVPEFSLSLSVEQAPEQAAEGLRDALGVSIEEQLSWRDGRRALHKWQRAVEALGVLVFQTESSRYSVEVAEMRGVALHAKRLPIILLNGRDALAGKTFTLMHELAHLATGSEAVCDLESESDPEIYCNAVAGRLLVPRADLEMQIAARGYVGQEAQDGVIGELARDFSVSRETLARRLADAHHISKQTYQRKRVQYQEAWQKQKSSREPFPVPREIMCLRDNGPTYCGLVFDAYLSGSITPGDAARSLGTSIAQLGDARDRWLARAQV
jgi:Zn-dependent peptidase ImmA (M78 family)